MAAHAAAWIAGSMACGALAKIAMGEEKLGRAGLYLLVSIVWFVLAIMEMLS